MYVVTIDRDEDELEFKVFASQPGANDHANDRHNEGDCVVSVYAVDEEQDVRRAIWLVKNEDCTLVKTMPRKLSPKEQADIKMRDTMRKIGIIK